MINLITNLQKNGSTLKKAELLKNFHDPERLKEVLTYTLDPNRNYYIKKLPEFGIGTVSNFNVAWASFRMHLDRLAARDITGNEAIHATVHLLEQMTPKLQEVMKRILFRDLRCNVSDKIANKVFPKLIPEFKVQLANKFLADKKYKNTQWAASRKLDGLRCVLKNGILYTRNGKEIVGFDHIVDELKTLTDYENIILVDGELYSHDIPFQKIQGYVTRNKNVVAADKKKIFFNIFAILRAYKTIDTASMLKELADLREKSQYTYLKFVEYIVIDNDADKVYELDKKFVAEGYEGVMLRSMDQVYDWKRSNALVKYKSFKEESLTVVGLIEGEGKYKGKLGAFMCEGEVEGYKVKTEVGSGFDDEQREEFWENGKSLVGKLISVKYQNLSDDNASLRFPIFLGFQLDR